MPNRHRLPTAAVAAASLALAIALFAGAGCTILPPRADREPVPLSLDEVEARLGRPGVHLFDANPREMYDAKHLPGARWVKWNEVTAADLPRDRAATLIFYCAIDECSASREAATRAIRLGYTNVFVMPKGILGWKKAGKPVEAS